VVLLFFPFIFWLILQLGLKMDPGKEVCATAAFGLRTTCAVVRRESFYSIAMAFRHAYWVVFFLLFEGPGAFLTPGAVSLLSVGCVGVFLGNWFPVVGRYLVHSCVVLVCWARVKKVFPMFRWIALLFLVLDFNVFLVGLEAVVLWDREEKYEEVEEEVVDCYVPHILLSLEVPVGSCQMTTGYFENRAAEESMTDDERVMALKGDRFLKWCAVRYIALQGGTVALVTVYEAAQTDEVFRGWVFTKIGELGHGKKTRASYPEVMWGEIFDLFVDGQLSFVRVWDAFVAFQAETLVVAKVTGI
jgi:hypothetical protein